MEKRVCLKIIFIIPEIILNFWIFIHVSDFVFFLTLKLYVMKKLFFTISTMLGLTLIVFNYSLKDNSITSNKHNDILLNNIQTLQASAQVEYSCDHSSSSTCTFKIGGTPSGEVYDTGQPVIRF